MVQKTREQGRQDFVIESARLLQVSSRLGPSIPLKAHSFAFSIAPLLDKRLSISASEEKRVKAENDRVSLGPRQFCRGYYNTKIFKRSVSSNFLLESD